jgi:phospholipase/carboxylesterase
MVPAAAAASAAVEGSIDGISFIELVTSGASADAALPLVLVLHPQGSAPADFADFVRGLAAQSRVVMPYADPANGVFSWYRGNSTDAGAPGPRRAAQRLANMLPELSRTRATAGKPIVMGYSQGAIVAMTMAVTDSADLAAVVAIAGRLPPALFARARQVLPSPRIEAFHGAADGTVPHGACKKSIAVLREAGFAATLHTYPGVGHEISPTEAADAIAALATAVADATKPPPPAEAPYPAVWINEVGAGQECTRLVYKHGCHAVRRGLVEVTVFLDGQGLVRDVRTVKNTVTLDPELVESCVHGSIKKRKWKPPQGVSHSFTVRIVLSDKC